MSDDAKQKIDDGGPAFPGWHTEYFQREGGILGECEFQSGMSTRTWLAGRAMQGILAHRGIVLNLVKSSRELTVLIEDSAGIADAMLAQLHKDSPDDN